MAFVFRQDIPGIWKVVEPFSFRFGEERYEVPAGFEFDVTSGLATRHLPLARVDLRDFAAADRVGRVLYAQGRRAEAIRKVATVLNEALAASGMPVLARARTWLVLSWTSIF
jgi:hypothetical protein